MSKFDATYKKLLNEDNYSEQLFIINDFDIVEEDAGGPSIADTMKECWEKFAISLVIKNRYGVGGGNPQCAAIGSKDKLAKFRKEFLIIPAGGSEEGIKQDLADPKYYAIEPFNI